MAGSLSNYGEQLILNLIFRKTQSGAVAPDNLYVGLTKGAIYDSQLSTSQLANEVTDGHYNRQYVTFGAPVVDGEGSSTVATNNRDVAFGPWDLSETEDITHGFICDAAVGDANIIAWMQLDFAKKPNGGDMLVFYEGDMKLLLD